MLVLQMDGDHGFLHSDVEKKAETKLKRRTCYWTRTPVIEHARSKV